SLFSLLRSVDLCDLHSFPTRRSSDLWSEFWLLDPLDGTKEFLHQRSEFTINLSLVRSSLTTFAILAVPEQQLIYFCPEQGLPYKDRKSTRLNSSHVKISYAVFCLKKK